MKNFELYNNINRFPFKSTLSLTNLIGYWQIQASDKNNFIANTIVSALKQAPELFKPIEDLSILEKYKSTIAMMMTAVFPSALQEDDLLAAAVPYHLDTFYATKKFNTVLKMEHFDFKMNVDPDDMVLNKTLSAYGAILEQWYGIKLKFEKPLVVSLPNDETQLIRHYKVNIYEKFIEIKLHGELPELSEEKVKRLFDNVYDINLWKEYLPPELFEFQGFSIFRLIDVTDQEVLSTLKYDLLETNSIVATPSFNQLQEKLRVLFKVKDLKLGVAAFHKSSNNFVSFGRKICHSLLLSNLKGAECSCQYNDVYKRFTENNEPVIIADLKKDDLFNKYGVEMADKGIRNLVIAPLYYEGQFIGLMELGSSEPNRLNSIALLKIRQIVPLFSIAVKRSSEELENQVRTIIKENYTSLHPSVEWKFTNAALNLIHKEKNGEEANKIEPIVFEEVYPLYGATDIRGSSTERNNAIQMDLLEQLNLVKKVIDETYHHNKLPILDELKFRINKNVRKIKKGLFSGDEINIIEFLQKEVEPILQNLSKKDPAIAKISDYYFNVLDPELGIIYKKRKDFEDSLTTINDMVAGYLDAEEEKTQNMMPHYFEKYKTDGVEYNIYIGSSILNKKEFDPIYLRNLRLWQLISMAEIAQKVENLKPKLKVPLETTQLVLSHSAPLGIRFRMDEKKFDVDGAYNIRYEIVKKRIDKAFIKGSNERITQPGTIVIVYSQNKEAVEYKKYIEYLQNKGLLKPGIEELELEELQGTRGLKALRVSVNIYELKKKPAAKTSFLEVVPAN